jgi:hypothetical protein
VSESEVIILLRTILEQTTGPLTDLELLEVLDLTATDIKANRVGFGKRTSLSQAVEIAAGCFVALGRGMVA